MTERAPAPMAGFEVAETFGNIVEFDQLRRGLLALLAVLVVFCTLVLGCVFGALRLSGAGWVLAVSVSAGVCLAWYAARRRQFEATVATSVLELSPDGLVLTGGHVLTALPWPGLRRIARANPFGAEEVVVGVGTTTVTMYPPLYLRGYAAARATGTIPLTGFDPDWRAGRIGQWIQAYRPDLL